MLETKKNKNDEEVDLGSLFVIIGKGFAKIFNFIERTFKGLFRFFINTLLFLKKNTVKIVAAILVGAIIGLILDLKGQTKYEAFLYVKPNFGSTRQLYNNIGYYNDLVQQKDTILLAKTFSISIKEATSLNKFEIKPIVNENDILTDFNSLIEKIDTIVAKSYPYEKFKETFSKYDYHTQKISVVSATNSIFRKLTDSIVGSISRNNYFKKKKELAVDNLSRSELLIKKNLLQSDSLHHIYKKVLLAEAKKTSTGTNIDLGNSKTTRGELELFEKNKELNEDLEKVNDKISEKTKIINIVSDFQVIGHKVADVERKKSFQGGVISGALMILFLLLIKLNRFLNNYK